MIKQKKMSISFVTILFRLILTLLLFSVSLSASTYYVATNGSNTAPYDTWAKAATSIQTAVNAASNCDIIMVGSSGGHGTGIYKENVVVNKQITINSEIGYSTTTVAAANPEADVFLITVDNVNISGFSIYGGTDMWIDQSGELHFPSGIYLKKVDGCTIENNRSGWDGTHRNSFGIRIAASRNCVVSNNITSYNAGPGIAVDSSSENTIVSNVITNNKVDGFPVGFSWGNTIEGNTVSNNDLNGFIVGQSKSNIFKNNIVSGNGYHGFQIVESTDNTFTGNTANNNNINGIYFVMSDSNTLDSDTANSNKGVGIGMDNSSDNKVTSCTVTHNEYGIYMWGSSNNIIDSNIMNNNDGRPDGDGIMLGESTNNTIANNTMKNDPGDGIEFYESSNNNVIGNTVINSGWGIRINYKSANNVLSYNTVNDGVKGIILEEANSVNNILAYNTTNNNSEDGIFLYDSTWSNILVGNTASNNTNHGIHINTSDANTVYLNNLFANKDNNISIGDSNNIWQSPVVLNYNYNSGTFYKGYLGNYYDDGIHTGSNGIGGTYNLDTLDTDDYQLINTSDNYSLQAWWLNKDNNMYLDDAGRAGSSVAISKGGTFIWKSNVTIPANVNFPGSGGWTGQLVFTSAPANGHTFNVEVGSSSGGSNFTSSGPDATITGDGSSTNFTFVTDTSTFMVPTGNYLAFRITSNNAEYSIWTGGAWSFISSPEGSAGYTAPVGVSLEIPFEHSLKQNYPNPFNPATTIKYSIPQNDFITLKVYDILGREVATLVNEENLPGNYEVKFDGSNYASGIYIYRLTGSNVNLIKKMILMK